MKLSYREKIGLLVLLVAVVIIIFVAWPIRLIRANIKAHKVEEAKVLEEYEETHRLIDQIPTIEGNIKRVYEESKGLSAKFAPHMENIEFDKYFETLLNKEPYKKAGKNALELTGGLTISDAGTGTIPFYYYTPNVITYPILEYADTNGNLLETTDKALYDKAVNAYSMETLTPQDVEVRTISVPMKFTKEALLALEDELKKDGTGMRITSVTIDDYTFNNASDIPSAPAGQNNQDDKGYSEGEVVFEFYTMQQIQEPDFSK